MNALERFTTPVRTWFQESFGRPTPAQEKGWPPIQAGEHTLILSPTGSGKTLAAFLWAIDRLFAELEATGDPGGVRLLYISPLKALNNDIERNLRAPLAGAREAAVHLGHELPELRVAVRTGDTPGRARLAMLKRPPHILITTPESFYLILTSSKARQMLRTVRTVIVDEIHTVAGNKRGVHLALSLERLEHLAEGPLQRIGLSATQRPLEVVARFLGGQEWSEGPDGERTLVPRPVTIVDAGQAKALDLRVVTVVEDFRGLGGSIWPSVDQEVVEAIRTHRSTLVFANGRRLAERIAGRLSEQLGVRVRAHHGSMAAPARLEMEADLKAGRLPALVGTSSLELGIDIGAVDLVVQVQSPKGVAQGLQRVGRSGHLVGQTSVGRIFPTHREDLMEAAVVAGAMLRGEVEPTRVPENCLDVLAQQVVAAVSMEDWSSAALYDLVRQSYPYRHLTPDAYHEVLAMLAGKYPREVFRELRPRLDWDRASGRLSALPGSAYLATASGGTIADRGAFGAYLADGKTKIGELDEEFIYERREGDVFTLGSRTWRIERILDDRVLVTDSPGTLSMMPFWKGDMPWRTYDLGLAVGRFRRQVAERLADPDLVGWLQREYALDDNSAHNVVAYVRDQVETAGAISSDRSIVVELLRDPLGDARLIVHSPFGGRVNAAWGLALAGALRERCHTTPECQTNDDAILLRIPEADQAPPIDLLTSLTPAEARERILAELPDSALFGAQFRQNAARALLMPRAKGRRRTPFWLQRLRAKDLLAATRQFDSFPIIVETYRDCLRDVLDLENLLEVLAGIQEGRIQVVSIERVTPSPAAAGLLRQFIGIYMYEWDEPKAERQLRHLALNRDLLQRLLGGVSLADLLRPEALQALEAHLQRTAHNRRARSPQELALLLQELGDLSTEEVLERTEEGGRRWLASLATEGRIVERVIPTAHGPARRWLLASEACIYERAFAAASTPSLPEREGDVESARQALLRRLLMTHGPLTVDEIRARYDLPAGWLAATLAAWADERRIAHGRLRPDSSTDEWCDRQNLEQAHRRTLALLRREVQPVPLERYVDFLARWQHVHPAHTLPAGGLRRAIQQLRALPAPALLWARDLLPARVQGFRPADLEALCQGGEVVWVGSGSERPAHLRARLLFRGEGSLYLAPPQERTDLSQAAQRVLACLKSEGACFSADLERGTGLRGHALAAALVELTTAGLVTNDSLRALQEVVRFRPGAAGGPRRPLSSVEAQLAERWSGPPQRRPGRLREARQRAARRLAATPQWVGRWSLVQRLGTWGAGATPEERLDRQARQLLARYGILARECLAREDLEATWSDLYSYLELLEMRGELRRGYFVQGLSGAQFALPEAVEHLREWGAAPAAGDEAPLVVLNAWDPVWAPAALAGLAGRAVPRRSSTYIALQGSVPLLVAERRGQALGVLQGVEGAALVAALSACFSAICARSGRRRLLVETWNGAPVLGSPGQPLLERIGGYPHPPGIEWQAASV
jgi:ATP-dependent Lhr-like helicase